MTRDTDIMEVFRQNEHFLKVMEVRKARVQVLIAWGAILRNGGSLKGLIE
jgi:hypothetical protein